MANGKLSSRRSVTKRWVIVAGALLGTLTLLFLMALVLLSIVGHEVPVGSRFLVVSVLAFGAGLSSAFLGGTAAASGSIPLAFASNYPIEFSAAGGIGVLITVMLLGNYMWVKNGEKPSTIVGHVILFDGFSKYSESGFSFSSKKVVPWNSGQADILVSNNKDHNSTTKLFVPYDSTPFISNRARGGIVKMTQVHLDDDAECPSEGYSHHWFDAHQNAIYCLRTRDGQHFAKIKITEVDADRIAFDWVFQPSGSPSFK